MTKEQLKAAFEKSEALTQEFLRRGDFYEDASKHASDLRHDNPEMTAQYSDDQLRMVAAAIGSAKVMLDFIRHELGMCENCQDGDSVDWSKAAKA